jgi:hypothetical protein
MAKSGPFAWAVNVFHDSDVGLSLVDSPVTPLPRQRTTALPPASGAGPAVIPPHVGLPAAHRARPLRAWMLALPVDLAAFLVPLTWNREYWKGIIVAGL